MQPIDANISPKVHVPALNHIGLWVDNLEAAHAHLTASGIRFAGGIRKGAGNAQFFLFSWWLISAC